MLHNYYTLLPKLLSHLKEASMHYVMEYDGAVYSMLEFFTLYGNYDVTIIVNLFINNYE